MITTHITREQFDQGCLAYSGSRGDWCDGAVSFGNGYADPGPATFIVRQARPAAFAARTGRAYTDLPACTKHAFGLRNETNYTAYPVADVTFA